MVITRFVPAADPFVHANLVDALAGAGAPVGIESVTVEESRITITFDDARTSPELIDDLVAVASTFVPGRRTAICGPAEAAARAAHGLGDPDLTADRIIETHLA